MRKKTIEEFKKEVYDLVGSEYTVVGDYVNTVTPIGIVHNTCGTITYPCPNDFLRGTRCRYCSYKKRSLARKKPIEKLRKEIFDLVKDEYTLVDSNYTNNSSKLTFYHLSCKNKFKMTAGNFLSGQRCPYCYGTHKKSTTEFKSEVEKLVKKEYTLLSEYSSNKILVTMSHNICGSVYQVLPNAFLRGARCPNCFGNIKKTTEQFRNEVYNLEKNEYLVLDEYVNSKVPIKMKHKKCGTEFMVKPNHFLSGSRCPKCRSSKMEKKINTTLTELNVKFETQKKFPTCKYINELPFDFYINKNDKEFVIEYDGRFHFEPIFSTEDLKLQKIRDNIKTKFCIDNNIILLRIDYKDKDPINTLIKFLKTNNII